MNFLLDPSWIHNLLQELKTFAEANNLPKLASHLADASQIAECEWDKNASGNPSILEFERQLYELLYSHEAESRDNVIFFPPIYKDRRLRL